MSQLYISYVNHSTMTKNKLQETVDKFVRSRNLKLIKAEDLEIFKESILDRIQRENRDNKRCTPLQAYFYDHENDGECSLWGLDFISLTIMPCEEYKDDTTGAGWWGEVYNENT